MEVKKLLERGKIMKLCGLSNENAQYTDNIVSIEERSAEDGDVSCICEVILGDSKGKMLTVRETNLMEIPSPPPEQVESLDEEFCNLHKAFHETRISERSSDQREAINSIYKKAQDMLIDLPNDCMLWDFHFQLSKLFVLFVNLLCFDFISHITTAHYLGLGGSAERLKCIQRAIANPIHLGEADDSDKMYMIGNLADNFRSQDREKDAQTLFKYIIDSNLIPADLYRFHLANSYMQTREYDEAGDILSSLYCKRVFEARSEYLSFFEEQNRGVCFREAIYRMLDHLNEHYFDLGQEHSKKGEALAAAGNQAGN